MKFDIAIMNPPYDKNLHLDILEKVVPISDDIVSIQPCKWLISSHVRFNPHSAYYKYQYSISEHITDMDIIDMTEQCNGFNIRYVGNLAIFTLQNNPEIKFDYENIFRDELVERVIKYINCNLIPSEFNKKDGYRVRLPRIARTESSMFHVKRKPLASPVISYFTKDLIFYNGELNGKPWHEYYIKNNLSKTTDYITWSVKLDTEEECRNFMRSFSTDFVCYLCNKLIVGMSLSDRDYLWMGNAVNPRTGLLGYKGEWTDEDFYQFFHVTEEEKKLILDRKELYLQKYKEYTDRHNKEK